MMTIGLDAGERADEPEELLAAVDRLHVACGGHAGDDASMRRTVTIARVHGVELGAHPSYADVARFGRVSVAMPPAEVGAAVATQCAALRAIAGELGVAVVSAKPHGALYHDTLCDRALASAVLDAIVATLGAVAVVTGPGALADVASARGLVVQREGFVDRGLHADGSLIARGQPGALIDDPAVAATQARRLAATGTVDILCVHGDGADPLAVVRAVRRALAGS